MALTKCPECGKESISDSAESCPNCGYGIKSHFLEKRIQEQEKLKLAEAQQRLEKMKLLEKKEIEDEKTKNEKKIEELASKIVVPKVRPFINGWLVLLIGTFLINAAVLWNMISMRLSEELSYSYSEQMISLGYFLAIFLILGIVFSIKGFSQLNKSKEMYDQYSSNEDEYKKALAIIMLHEIEKQDKTQESKDRIQEVRNAKQRNVIQNTNIDRIDIGENGVIRCPNCGSTQFQMMNRRWTVGTGFLTNKIDRVCMNCKHKF